MRRASLGNMVHYVGRPVVGVEHSSACRAAMVCQVEPYGGLSLFVISVDMLGFRHSVGESSEEHEPGTWHWEEDC